MSLDRVLAELDEFRDEHERLRYSERHAREGLKVLQAEVEALHQRPVDLRRCQAQVRSLRGDLNLAQRELRTVAAERDVTSQRLDGLLDIAEQRYEQAGAQRSDELRQAQRRLNTALAANTRLAAELAEEKDRAARAEQIAEQSRRALTDHAART